MEQFENKAKRYAENLRSLRGLKGWSRTRLAKEAGITPNSIKSYEEGLTLPNVMTACTIANIFGVLVEDMIEKTVAVEVKMK